MLATDRLAQSCAFTEAQMEYTLRVIVGAAPVFVLGMAILFFVSIIHSLLSHSMVFTRFIPLATVFLTFVIFTEPVLRAVMWWRDTLQGEGDWANMLGGLILLLGGVAGFDATKRILPVLKNILRKFRE